MRSQGFLNLIKVPGLTSHDLVREVRRLFGERRVGHGGTLDPGAAGVLVVAVGEATKALAFMENHIKEYWAEAEFGTSTSTQDADGTVVGVSEPGWHVTLDQLRVALSHLTGTVRQVPPMYSAVHHEGQRLYQLARAGEEVEREVREIQVTRFELVEVVQAENGGIGCGTRARLRIVCSKGTYVRTLIHDLGVALGGYAHLRFLLRTASGPFRLEEGVTLEEVEATGRAGGVAFLRPSDAGLTFDAVELGADASGRFRQGRAIALPWSMEESSASPEAHGPDGLRRVYSQNVNGARSFAGVGRLENGLLYPVRVFTGI